MGHFEKRPDRMLWNRTFNQDGTRRAESQRQENQLCFSIFSEPPMLGLDDCGQTAHFLGNAI